MGGGRLLRATACSTLGDELVVGTLVSGIASNLGWSTLGDGVPVVGGGGALCWRLAGGYCGVVGWPRLAQWTHLWKIGLFRRGR